MPRRWKKPYSKKIKRRKPVREAFFKEYVSGNETLLSVRFTHIGDEDVLLVETATTVTGTLPVLYEGYRVKYVEKG